MNKFIADSFAKMLAVLNIFAVFGIIAVSTVFIFIGDPELALGYKLLICLSALSGYVLFMGLVSTFVVMNQTMQSIDAKLTKNFSQSHVVELTSEPPERIAPTL